MALNDEQQRRLNNLVSAAKVLLPDVMDSLDRIDNIQNVYVAFQQSGLVEADITDADFQGGNGYITRQGWLDFMYAVGVLNNAADDTRTALLALLDSVPV